MLDFTKIKTSLESSFNKDKSSGINVSINVNVVNEDIGKFSVNVFDEQCKVESQLLPEADITLGFVNKDAMIDMFNNGADPVKMVMGGQMTFNGDMAKGKSMKGLFIGGR